MRFVLSSLVVLSLLPAPQQQQPTFRAGTSLVPVNIRVIDDHGNPVTNLRQEDFSVFEDGVLQPIRLFDAHALTAAASGAVRQPNEVAATRVSPQDRRVFLIVLGRGRLNQVSGGLDAAIDFVSHRLLPQDLVAVLAWNRATAFTTDRAFSLDVLRRFARAHESIDQQIREWFSGLRVQFGSPRIPDEIQSQIDPIFSGDPLAGTTLLAGAASDQPGMAGSPLGRGFDSYIANEVKSNQDLDKIAAGVEYLRGVEGEKHLIFMTDAGIVGGNADPERDLAARASDARVAIDYVQTGGIMPTGPLALYANSPRDGRVMASGLALAALERTADTTGGTGSLLSQAVSGFDAIDRATRFEYLIGYEPANKTTTPFVRHIEVKVKRPGVHVIARRTYYATPLPTLTGRAFSAYTTILREVGEQTLPVGVAKQTTDFPMSASALDITDSDGPGVDVTVNVDAARFIFNSVKDREVVASLDVAIFARKGTQRTISWHTVDLRASSVEQATGQPLPMSFRLRAHTVPKPEEVIVVVYEYGPEIVSFAYARKSGR